MAINSSSRQPDQHLAGAVRLGLQPSIKGWISRLVADGQPSLTSILPVLRPSNSPIKA
ncbi:hypothetical protein ACFONI_22600 [Aeromonas media]|uniref:hypothetical protein n=1 Tax=Aeromonas media TaxID=651 RepID=UPI0036122A73